MKISVKMALFAILIIVVALAICCALVLSFARSNTTDNIRATGLSDYDHFYATLSSKDTIDESTGTDTLKYSYTKYIFQSCPGSFEYVLKKDDHYISNNTGIDPDVLLENSADKVTNNETHEYVFTTVDNRDLFVAAQDIFLSNDFYTLFLVRDITEAMSSINELMINCVIACSIVAGAAIALMTFLIWRSLRPLKQLAEGAERFASGEYTSRIHIKEKNEIGELADSFNSMADSIENHISEIEATSEERRMLLSALSHEMKTPVTAITGYAHALTHAKLNEEQKIESVQFIDSECRRLERLSGKLIQLISLNGNELLLQDVSTKDLANDLKAIILPIANSCGISCNIDSDEKSLHIEKDLIISLVTNLFDNSRKAGSHNIAISIKGDAIRVSDDGKGIPSAEIEKITQPFYMLDKSRNAEGFGLGLALVRRIVELHDADLVINSEEGLGTTVDIL